MWRPSRSRRASTPPPAAGSMTSTGPMARPTPPMPWNQASRAKSWLPGKRHRRWRLEPGAKPDHGSLRQALRRTLSRERKPEPVAEGRRSSVQGSGADRPWRPAFPCVSTTASNAGDDRAVEAVASRPARSATRSGRIRQPSPSRPAAARGRCAPDQASGPPPPIPMRKDNEGRPLTLRPAATATPRSRLRRQRRTIAATAPVPARGTPRSARKSQKSAGTKRMVAPVPAARPL